MAFMTEKNGFGYADDALGFDKDVENY